MITSGALFIALFSMRVKLARKNSDEWNMVLLGSIFGIVSGAFTVVVAFIPADMAPELHSEFSWGILIPMGGTLLFIASEFWMRELNRRMKTILILFFPFHALQAEML